MLCECISIKLVLPKKKKKKPTFVGNSFGTETKKKSLEIFIVETV